MFLVRSCKSLGLFVWNMALLAFWVANILLIICGHAKGRVWPQIQQARLAPCQMPVVNSIINKTPKTNYFVVLSTVPKWKIPKKTVIYVQHITPYSKIISTQLWDMGWFSSFEFTSTTLSSLGSLGRKPDMGSTCRPGTQNLGMQLANDADLDARADDMRLHPGKEGLGCHGEALLQPFFSQKKKEVGKLCVQIILSPSQVAGSLLASSLKVLRLEPSFCSCSGSPQCSQWNPCKIMGWMRNSWIGACCGN